MIGPTREDMAARFGEEEMAAIESRLGADGFAACLRDAGELAAAHLRLARVDEAKARDSPLLMRIMCDVARWNLYEDGATDIVAERYREALEMLRIGAKDPRFWGLEPASGPGADSWRAPDAYCIPFNPRWVSPPEPFGDGGGD